MALEDVMNGVQTYRNPKLVHIYDKLGLIENFGTGIPRTIDAYQGSDLKTIFESSDKYFFVTLPNLNYKQPDQINDHINDMGLLILRVVKGKSGLNVPQILDEIKPEMPDVNADRIRNELRRNLTKYIEHRGSNKTGGYYGLLRLIGRSI